LFSSVAYASSSDNEIVFGIYALKKKRSIMGIRNQVSFSAHFLLGAAFLPAAFLAGALLAGAAFLVTFLAGAAFLVTFLAGAAFLVTLLGAAFLGAALLGAATLVARAKEKTNLVRCREGDCVSHERQKFSL